jgi:hypothetical protein
MAAPGWQGAAGPPIFEAMRGLPRWVSDERSAVEHEAAPYRGLSFAERGRLTAMACRAAARQLAARSDRERLLAYRDPLPESTQRTLARLRARWRTARPQP